MNNIRDTPKTPHARMLAYWTDFLYGELMKSITIDNMKHDMEISVKMNLFSSGKVIFFEDNSNMLVSLPFSNSGESTLYRGIYDTFIVDNPIIGSYELNSENSVPLYLTQLDKLSMSRGLSEIVHTTAEKLSRNDISVEHLNYVSRMSTVFTATSDTHILSINKMLEDVKNGIFDIVVPRKLRDAMEMLTASKTCDVRLTDFMEFHTYTLGMFYQLIGLPVPWNTKRERVQNAELDYNETVSMYNIDFIVDYLNKQLQEVNNRFSENFHATKNFKRGENNVIETDETEKPTNDNNGTSSL